MELSRALRLQGGDIVAFVGAGGKTSCLRRITSELSKQMLVIATTTTKLAEHDISLASSHHVIDRPDDLDRVLASLAPHGSALFTGPKIEPEGKWRGLTPADLGRLITFTKAKAGIVLIEADGARGAKIKAPAAHEPVIPADVTLVVPLLRIDALGLRPEDAQVHRPEQVAKLLGIEPGQPILLDHLAGLITHAEGGLKNIPESAVVRVFINAVESSERKTAAQALAQRLHEETRIHSVILGALLAADPVLEVWGRTGVVVLAAGGSERFGGVKLLQSWRGRPILRQVVETVLASAVHPAVVVLGAHYEQVKASIADLPIRCVENARWKEGQSSSLKIGLESIQDQCEAVLFVLGDMPDVDHELLRILVDAHRKSLHSVIAPAAGDRWGNPVLFDQRTFDELLSLSGDRGGRALFERFPPFSVPADKSVLFDIDSPEDLNSAS
ncbi:MAG: putative selenium-dependent hydroxylase accessory protein YqeC [Anaerolineales bacterium]|nr:MAG: putative selenium-dependent hydroxylase accessory protein YqeC [Anaerolineales bacterium]